MPNILLKCNRAYLQYSARYAAVNIWTVLPDYFRKTQEAMEETTNRLENFLKSEELAFGPDLYMPIREFKNACTNHLRANGYQPVVWNKDMFEVPFQKRGMGVTKTETRRYAGEKMSCQWVTGCDFRGEPMDEESQL